ncbi:hypothetical protein GGQ02_003100 [Salinibacter ruber]|nr:hypothetical protein [Salinibacter ruber]
MAYKFEQLEVWQKALDYADRKKDRRRRTADGGWGLPRSKMHH